VPIADINDTPGAAATAGERGSSMSACIETRSADPAWLSMVQTRRIEAQPLSVDNENIDPLVVYRGERVSIV
jgi:hypothetical protein